MTALQAEFNDKLIWILTKLTLDMSPPLQESVRKDLQELSELQIQIKENLARFRKGLREAREKYEEEKKGAS